MYKIRSSPHPRCHRALQNSSATLWYHRGPTTNACEILIWHMSPVFCKYAEYFPPTVSENSCLLSQCRHRVKFFKTSPPRRESRKYFQTKFCINVDEQIVVFTNEWRWLDEQAPDRSHPLPHADSGSGFLAPCCSRCCSGRQRWAWGGGNGVCDRAAPVPRQTRPLWGRS